MFVSQAHSFIQQARLAITLAWVAGYTNIVAILTCGHVASHVSGTTTDVGRAIATLDPRLLLLSLWLLATFLLGAIISGVASEIARKRAWESVYVLPMALEALLLTGFAIGVEYHDPASIEHGWRLYMLLGLASAAMGLQNATITRISGGYIRTTHVTGVLTDLGVELVQYGFWAHTRARAMLRAVLMGGLSTADAFSLPASILQRLRHHSPTWRLLVLSGVIASFALGAMLGALAFYTVPTYSMFPPVLFLLVLIYQDAVRPIAEIEPSDLEGLGLDLPEGIAVYRLRPKPGRSTQRVPDLLAWSQALPNAARVVILDLSDTPQLDENSALELRAAATLLRGTRRRLVLAGISVEHFRQLRSALGRTAPLDPLDALPDLELAIARALNAHAEDRAAQDDDPA